MAFFRPVVLLLAEYYDRFTSNNSHNSSNQNNRPPHRDQSRPPHNSSANCSQGSDPDPCTRRTRNMQQNRPSRQTPTTNARSAHTSSSTRNQTQTGTTSDAANRNAVEKLDIQDISDLNDINNLTVKQLKVLLTRNCIDYRGVFEKEVLREKAMQLWIDHNERRATRLANRTSNQDGSHDGGDDIPDIQLCKICMEREADCVLLECGHLFTCTDCGRKLAECSICRQNVVRCVRTFRA